MFEISRTYVYYYNDQEEILRYHLRTMIEYCSTGENVGIKWSHFISSALRHKRRHSILFCLLFSPEQIFNEQQKLFLLATRLVVQTWGKTSFCEPLCKRTPSILFDASSEKETYKYMQIHL